MKNSALNVASQTLFRRSGLSDDVEEWLRTNGITE